MYRKGGFSARRLFEGAVARTFSDTYPPDGHDFIFDEYNGRSTADASVKSLSTNYLKDRTTRITSFLGLPNYLPDNESAQSWLNIGKNLIGWQDNKTTSGLAFNILKALFVFPWNLMIAFFTTFRNIIKLGTEFLPCFLANVCLVFKLYAYVRFDNSKSQSKRLGFGILFGVAVVGEVFFRIIHFIGQAVTSPIQGVMSAWKLGQDLAGKGFWGQVLSWALISLSIAITTTFYVVAFPAAIHILGPMILSKVPVLSSAINAIVHSQAMSTVGNFLMPILGKAFTAMSIIASPAAIGFATIASPVLIFFGTAISLGINVFRKWWNQSSIIVKNESNQNSSSNERDEFVDDVTVINSEVKDKVQETSKETDVNIEAKPQTLPANVGDDQPRPPVSSSNPGVSRYGKFPKSCTMGSLSIENTDTWERNLKL